MKGKELILSCCRRSSQARLASQWTDSEGAKLGLVSERVTTSMTVSTCCCTVFAKPN